jgi:hypothetical protein
MAASSKTATFVHLPLGYARIIMTERDVLYNNLQKYLKDQGVGYRADLVVSLGDEFTKHLSSAIFHLRQKLWKSLNDPHNQ